MLAVAPLLVTLGGCTVGSRVDWDPDSVPEAYARSTATLAWPGATRAFQVTPEGDLANGAWRVRLAPSSGTTAAGAPRVIAFERRWLPVARWRRIAGPLRWDFEAVALPPPAGAARDSSLLVTLEARVHNTGPTAAPARLEVRLEDHDPAAPFAAFDAEPSGARRWAAGGGAAAAWGWTAERTEGGVAVHASIVEPGAARALRFVLPAYPTPDAELERWARTSHRRRVAEARVHWHQEVERSMRLSLGDPEVEDAVRAALVVLLSCRERRGPLWVPIGGPLHYRDVWLRDGARVVHALALAGRAEAARELAEGLAAYQWPMGVALSQRGQLDGFGQMLWALEQAWLRPAPAPGVEAAAGRALAAWRWCERQRAAGAGEDGGALLPPADPRDAELVDAALVGNDAWAIAGYRSAARLLAAAGRRAEADSVAGSRARYAADFAAALERSGSDDLPPSWSGIGRDWGNVAVAYPCAALPAAHPRCRRLARRLFAASPEPGLVTYAHRDSLHYYLGADLGTAALLAGDRAEAERVLAALLRWRSASGGAGEIFSHATRDYGLNPPPHATAAAVLIELVRNSLVHDEDDTLRLTLGARAEWWRGGRVRGAATRFGVVDLDFRRHADRAEWRFTPVAAWTALTLPPGTRLARPEPPLVAGPSPDVVLAPPGTGRARVRLAEAAR